MTTPRSDVHVASELVATASVALAEWHAHETVQARSYVAAGHRAVELIDDALRELHAARGRLVDEIHRDQVERDIRVDALLAGLRAEREARAYSRDDGGPTNEPLPPGVEGWRPGAGEPR